MEFTVIPMTSPFLWWSYSSGKYVEEFVKIREYEKNQNLDEFGNPQDAKPKLREKNQMKVAAPIKLKQRVATSDYN